MLKYFHATTCWMAVWLFVCLINPNANAQDSPPQAHSGAQTLSLGEVEKEIGNAYEKIQAAQRSATAETAARVGLTLEDLKAQVEKYTLLKAALSDLATALKRKEALAGQLEKVQEASKASIRQSVSSEPPYSLSFYDRFLQEAEQIEQTLKNLELAIPVANKTLEALQQRQAKVEQALQELAEPDETGQTSSASSIWKADLLRIDERILEVQLTHSRAHLENLKAEESIADLNYQTHRKQLDWVKVNLSVSQEDLDQQLAALDKRIDQLNKTLDRLIAEKSKIERTYDPQLLASHVNGVSDSATVAQERLQTQALWQETRQIGIDQTMESIRMLTDQKRVWQRRYDLHRNAQRADQLAAWEAASGQEVRKREQMIGAEQREQNGTMQQIDAIENRLANTAKPPTLVAQIKAQADALRQRIRQSIEFSGLLYASVQLDRRFLNEINAQQAQTPFFDQVMKVVLTAKRVWEYQVWMIDGNPVTVGKVFIALVILLVGLFAAKKVIKTIGRRLLQRTQVKQTTAATIEKLFSYLAYTMVVLFALRIVNIPLAAFAFLGGAVAIGIGFGAQNLINNFISGFIIMGEKPVGLNDLIEVEGVVGKVEEIGARCTRVRTGENIDILVPNSAFLEKNITNWTRTDNSIRTHVTVGVMYGSPVDQVRTLLLQAAGGVKEVAKTPSPFVLFTDFGDSALIFEVYFWIRVNRVIERRTVESEMRFRIDALFREADIVIAYPQQDVHLYAEQPLSIKTVPEG